MFMLTGICYALAYVLQMDWIHYAGSIFLGAGLEMFFEKDI